MFSTILSAGSAIELGCGVASAVPGPLSYCSFKHALEVKLQVVTQMRRLVDGLDAPVARSLSGEAHESCILQGDLVQRRPVTLKDMPQETLGDDAMHHDGGFLALACVLFEG